MPRSARPSPASRTPGSSGSAASWHGFDPTNSIEIGDRHVTVGRGRDYNDVAPLRGVYAGPYGSKLFVTVEITRESLSSRRELSAADSASTIAISRVAVSTSRRAPRPSRP